MATVKEESKEDEFTSALITCVRTRPELYDPGHECFKNALAKSLAWDHIIKMLTKMGYRTTVDDVKYKWKSLRDVYQKKIRHPKHGGGEPVWKHFNQMNNLLCECYEPGEKSFIVSLRKRKLEGVDIEEKPMTLIEGTSNIPSTSQTNEEGDECDNFGRHVADLLRQIKQKNKDHINVMKVVSFELFKHL